MSAPGGPPYAEGVAIGVDLGGTGTRLVALDGRGALVAEAIRPTATGVSSRTAVDELVTAIVELSAGHRIVAVGIGASGPVDQQGIIRNPDTLAAYSDVPIASVISERLGVPCVIDNDAATAAIGEFEYGAGRGSRGLLVVTLGTGVGVGVLYGGEPVRASDGTHPEAGHIPVPGPPAPCYCGLPICWEQLASRSALNRLTHNRTDEVAERARRGAPEAVACFETYGDHVGVGLAALTTLFRPDLVVIGGGAAQYLDLFEGQVTRALQREGAFATPTRIVAAELGAHSGAIGAAVLSRRDVRAAAAMIGP